MFQPQYFSAFLIPLIAFLSTSNAWQYSSTSVEFSSPAPVNQGSVIVNGQVLSNYTTNITGWPCYNYPIPHDVARTAFPVSGGRLSFTLTNDSVGSLKNYEFIGTTYIGEISRGDGTYTTTIPDASGGLNLGYYWSDDYVWRNFESGPDCSEPVHVVPVVSEALGKGLTAEDLVGMNATIGMRIVLFGPTPDSPYVDFADYNYEEMYQCGYITFTDKDLLNDPNAGYCNGGASPTGGSGAAPSTLLASPAPSATRRPHVSPPPHPFPAPAGSTDTSTSTSHAHTVALGTGVGVSMGVGLLFLILALVYLRRRKARKHTETISPDVMVSRQQDVELIGDENNGKKAEKGKNIVESSSSSIHSEQLPPYAAEDR